MRVKERPRAGGARPKGKEKFGQNTPLRIENRQTCPPAIYDGAAHVGYVIAGANTFAAYDAAGRHLGNFSSQTAAVRSLPRVWP